MSDLNRNNRIYPLLYCFYKIYLMRDSCFIWSISCCFLFRNKRRVRGSKMLP